MKLLRKDKKVERELPAFLKAGLSRFNKRLIAIANFLQQKTNDYSLRKKKLLLLLFIIAFVAASSVVLVRSIAGKNKTLVEVKRVKAIPVQSSETNAPQITKTEFLRIQKFKNYIDSLNRTAPGRAVKDRLLHNRPQLMDSVRFLINLYLEQSKTIVK
ncbi:MAG TPA: hypothetical protein VL095_07285 [Flavisolibacter sp.]|nr:hypothetical protein [Flavisolibacter sp.]